MHAGPYTSYPVSSIHTTLQPSITCDEIHIPLASIFLLDTPPSYNTSTYSNVLPTLYFIFHHLSCICSVLYSKKPSFSLIHMYISELESDVNKRQSFQGASSATPTAGVGYSTPTQAQYPLFSSLLLLLLLLFHTLLFYSLSFHSPL